MQVSDYIYSIVRNEAARNNIDSALILAVIEVESSFNPDAFNPRGPAYGLMQLKLSTAREVAGVPSLMPNDIMKPELNIELGTYYLAQKIKESFGNIERGLAIYGGVISNTSYITKVLSLIPKYREYVMTQEQAMPSLIEQAAQEEPESGSESAPNINKLSSFMWPYGAIIIGIGLLLVLRK